MFIHVKSFAVFTTSSTFAIVPSIISHSYPEIIPTAHKYCVLRQSCDWILSFRWYSLSDRTFDQTLSRVCRGWPTRLYMYLLHVSTTCISVEFSHNQA